MKAWPRWKAIHLMEIRIWSSSLCGLVDFVVWRWHDGGIIRSVKGGKKLRFEGLERGGKGITQFCRRPLSGPSGMKSPGDRKHRPSRSDRRFVKVLRQSDATPSKDPQTRKKPTRPSPRVINTSGNVLTNYLTCRFFPDSTVNSSMSSSPWISLDPGIIGTEILCIPENSWKTSEISGLAWKLLFFHSKKWEREKKEIIKKKLYLGINPFLKVQ